MSNRHFPDWLEAFAEYDSISEAPYDTIFWTGVSTIAGALRRRVYIDQLRYQYYTNHYIILVAPPGIIAKTTTAGVGQDLLRQVPGIKFGPGAATWQALIARLEEAAEEFEDENGDYRKQSALTIVSNELGNLIDPKNREMLDAYVDLWDSKSGWYEKATKTVGDNKFANAWLNIIACTTPSWLSNHMPEYVLGGGFVSRCTFVFADKKRQKIAYPSRHTRPSDYAEKKRLLITDLVKISELVGEVRLTEEAYAWGTAWYDQYADNPPPSWLGEHASGYWVRKQAHLHKLAMIISVSEGNTLRITPAQLERAQVWIDKMELNLHRVFDMVGRSGEAAISQAVLTTIRGLAGRQPSENVVMAMMTNRYSPQETKRAIDGLAASGQIRRVQVGDKIIVAATGPVPIPGLPGSPAAGPPPSATPPRPGEPPSDAGPLTG